MGEYDIIWQQGGFQQAVEAIHTKYPDILWVSAGAGNAPVGGNVYWVDIYSQEAAYLCGVIAGLMTKTNVISAVGAFPYPNINIPLNAYRAGARSVNPDIKFIVSYTEAWVDPVKAKEAGFAQIASGSDFIFCERFGVFGACQEKKKYAFGNMADLYSLAPDVVVTSAILRWDPLINYVIDEWWNHVTTGKPYDAPKGCTAYSMKEGASDIAPYHGFEDKIP